MVTGVTKPEEIKTIVKWFWDQHGKDQALFPTKMHTARCSVPQLGADILIKDPGSNTWGSDQTFDKHHIIQRLVGYRPTMGRNNRNDEISMDKFIGVASISSLHCPQFAP